MSKDIKNEEFEQDLQMLQYFQDEFQYRHKHFWYILILLFVLCVVIIILPIAPEVMGIKIQKLALSLPLYVLIAELLLCLLVLFVIWMS